MPSTKKNKAKTENPKITVTIELEGDDLAGFREHQTRIGVDAKSAVALSLFRKGVRAARTEARP